jgi:hypothetical protein
MEEGNAPYWGGWPSGHWLGVQRFEHTWSRIRRKRPRERPRPRDAKSQAGPVRQRRITPTLTVLNPLTRVLARPGPTAKHPLHPPSSPSSAFKKNPPPPRPCAAGFQAKLPPSSSRSVKVEPTRIPQPRPRVVSVSKSPPSAECPVAAALPAVPPPSAPAPDAPSRAPHPQAVPARTPVDAHVDAAGSDPARRGPGLRSQ